MRNILKYIAIWLTIFGILVLSACDLSTARKPIPNEGLVAATVAAQRVATTLKSGTGPADQSTLRLIKEDSTSYIFIVHTANFSQLPGQEWLIIYYKRNADVVALPGQ